MSGKNVEIVLKPNCKSVDNELFIAVENFLSNILRLKDGNIISSFDQNEHKLLYENVDYLIVDGLDINKEPKSNSCTKFFVYRLDNFGPQIETNEDNEIGEVKMGTTCQLPSSRYFGLWESLIYEDSIKTNLLKYASTAMLFADKNVDSNLISCNRVILLHGPPGTGKTSLCLALAQKLSIRLQSRYSKSILFEINSHSLFSKWFSESGKLVEKMFSEIREFLNNQKVLVFILIDEIESLAHAREKCMSDSEPSDSMRVVNALLTELDKIKRYSNVLIFTTSNVTGAIDLAFVDRADIKQFVGFLGVSAICQIYCSCLEELMKAKIIQPTILLSADTNSNEEFHKKILKVSEESVGLSGRTLRKLPLLAHAMFLGKEIATLDEFTDALYLAVTDYKKNAKLF